MLNTLCGSSRSSILRRTSNLLSNQIRLSSTANHSSSGGDTRLEVIRRILFEPPVRQKSIILEGEKLEQHETIERAWKLFKMRSREQRERTLERQFRAMQAAMNELEKTSERLFKGAIAKSRHLNYPKQAKIPTETPSAQGWDYSYKAPNIS
ncbi:mitochondrial ribosomal protein L28-domain-containing protein [Cokeromyces recurvatus]|uniref:mitochondrial ribosomal protein L28-domain-containing protein n=1 Tax=Cokeromyces recurvatus TaxID=90255 RepID=UPI00221FDA9D|nr:mitochondrial ribosomal protein L28-domain-containing protein [Cokeromyces recurvatus]KAI7905992.1 mitochondrial ribosomal protein L28-domain-containing protein [Cokeromyces recurvatus]